MTIPYLTTAEAAEYCRRSQRQFKRWVARYGIPAYGPGKNIYRAAELDLFLENPNCFKRSEQTRRGERGFTPVAV